MSSPSVKNPTDGGRAYDQAQYPQEPALIDASVYTDPDRYQRELDQVLMQSWLCACPSKQIPAPRDFFLWEHLGQSVLIVRNDAGELVAWHNVCQHRGAAIVDERRGHCPLGAFKCPWHGFAYDLDGTVVHTPLAEAFDPEQLKGLRAPKVEVAEWGGLVWISFEEKPPPLLDSLGGLRDELGWYGFEGWAADYSGTWELEANWKTCLDAFNETWHVPFTHRATVRGGLLWKDATIELLDPHSMMSIPLAGHADLDSTDVDRRASTLCHYLAFPNTIFNCFPRLAQCFSAWPSGPRTTTLTAWALVAPPQDGVSEDEWRARADRDWNHFCAVVEEDRAVLARAGAVYDSKGFRRNMFNAAEGRLTAFHRSVSERID